ncbi:DUF4382 domain-containing protein [Pseudoalteromonas sp. T1lg65]|uniref:DUF4382 domain-containing protein n=1 Tax=Pseudoalteromonas sp. T1lg65 TaxID=2077101 RepID=UPI003F79EB59
MNNRVNYLTALTSALMISACGGSGSDNKSNEQNSGSVTPKTTVTIGLSDAAVTNLSEVNLVIQSVTLRAEGQDDITFDTLDDSGNPQQVNLLDFTGDDVFLIVRDQEIPAGSYQWIRADVINGDSGENLELVSNVKYLDDTQAPLVVTRKANDGVGEIQLNDFTVNEGENELVLEFDLNKALHKRGNSNTVYLKPTAVRLENLLTTLDINGSLSDELKTACIADNSESAPENGDFKHVVYLYDSSVVDIGDISEQENAPNATATVDLESNYTIAFVKPGDYVIAYSCLGHLDDAETVDESFSLYQQKAISVTADTTVNFDVESN